MDAEHDICCQAVVSITCLSMTRAPGCAETALPLPQWTMLDASNITLKLKNQQATRNFFCDLAHMLSSVADAAADPGPPTLENECCFKEISEGCQTCTLLP